MKNNFPILSYDFLKITIFQAQILDVHYLDSRRLLSRQCTSTIQIVEVYYLDSGRLLSVSGFLDTALIFYYDILLQYFTTIFYYDISQLFLNPSVEQKLNNCYQHVCKHQSLIFVFIFVYIFFIYKSDLLQTLLFLST